MPLDVDFIENAGDTLIVHSLKIVNERTAVVTVASLDEGGMRTNMAMGIVVWNPETKDVCIYPEMLEFALPDKVAVQQLCLVHCLCVSWCPLIHISVNVCPLIPWINGICGCWVVEKRHISHSD